MAELRQLKIKTGSCKRLQKEYESYVRDTAKQQKKIDDMIAANADAYDIKKQREVFDETSAMIADSKSRLTAALEQLDQAISSLPADAASNPDAEAARQTFRAKSELSARPQVVIPQPPVVPVPSEEAEKLSFASASPSINKLESGKINAAKETLEKTIQGVLAEKGENQDPFYLVDLETLVEKYVQWRQLLPMVEPYYAVKCNPNPAILHTLERLGTGFDCASRDEIDRCLDMGVPSDHLIFANPCKLESHILHAKMRDVKKMTFDNEDELVKIARIFPEAELVLRIITDDSSSLCKFSSKFGALLKDVKRMLQLAQELSIKIIGVSFHVGSGCEDPAAFAKAVRDAATVFEWGKEYGHKMDLVDLGGGWQGDDRIKPALKDVAAHINPELWRFPQGTRFIAEPGRYFATKSHTIVIRIHSRRVIRDEHGAPVKVLYYVNDGVYQSFNCIFFDHQHPIPMVVPDKERPEQLKSGATLYPSTVFGPTCDSLDCIVKDFPMPLLDVGQWLYFDHMGAYTTAAATHFNGFSGAVTCHYMWGPRFVENIFEIAEGDLPGLPTRCQSVPSFLPRYADDAAVQEHQQPLEIMA